MRESQEEEEHSVLERKVIELEALVLEQEHRPYTALRRFLGRNGYCAGDPRRRAVTIAFVWRFVAPITLAGGAAIGGTVLAVLTYLAFLEQNRLITIQLKSSESQLNELRLRAERERMTRLVRRKSELIEILWATTDGGTTTDALTRGQDYPQSSVYSDASQLKEKRLRNDVPQASSRLRSAAVSELIAHLGELNEPLVLRGAQLASTDTLCAADLSGADLSSANLRKAKLAAAPSDLWGGAWVFADLSRANLVDCDLRGATMVGVDLRSADLRGALLDDAYLIGANCEGAVFSGDGPAIPNAAKDDISPWLSSPGKRVLLQDAWLDGANFSHAKLDGVDFRSASIREVNLNHAQISAAIFNYRALCLTKGVPTWDNRHPPRVHGERNDVDAEPAWLRELLDDS